jgi:uncharacterized protein with PQ loop repeat
MLMLYYYTESIELKKYISSSTRCLQYLQVLWSEGVTGLVYMYLPVYMANEWTLILILVNLFLKVLGIS